MSDVTVIGAGAWGINHVRTLSEMGRLGAIVETHVPRATQLAAQFPSVEILSSPEALWSRADLSAVVIATPAPSHKELTLAAVAAGKDVLVEKPMALSAEEAGVMTTAAAAAGRILMVGHLLLYKPAVVFLRDYLAAGHLGRVFTLHQERCKHGRARPVENALWSLGVHDVAALLYLVGEAPCHVVASAHAGLRTSIADDAYLHLAFPSGVQAHLHSSWLWPEDRRGLVIVGEKGMLVYDEKKETITLFHKTIDAALLNVDEGSEVLLQAEPGFQPLRAELEHFLACVETRRPPLSNGASGIEVLKVLDQAAV